MKLQLNTDIKTIKVEGTVNLNELFTKLKTILPDWEEYSLESNTVIQYWNNPIYIPTYRDPYPWITPNYYVGSSSTSSGPIALPTFTSSTYNVEL